MTIKAYRSTRYNAERMPKTPKRQETRRTGSFWGVSWQLDDDLDDADWDALPGRPSSRR
jgi:hypothetical protein